MGNGVSSLRFTRFDHSNIAHLNRSFDDHSSKLADHTQQLSNMNKLIQQIFDKNPTLVKPTDK